MNEMLIYPFERTSDLLNYSSFDYNKLLTKVTKIFKYLELTNRVKIKKVYFDFSQRKFKYQYLNQSDIFTIKAEYELKEKDKVSQKTFSVFMPKMDNRKIRINGYEMVPIYQLVDKSVVSRPGTILVRSAFNSLSIVFNDKWCKVFLFRKKLPLSLFFFAIWGFEKTCEYFGADIEKKPGVFKGSKENVMTYKTSDEVISIKIKNMSKLSKVGQLVFKTACKQKYNKDLRADFGSKEYFISNLGYHFYQVENYFNKGTEILESLANSFFDPITKEQLGFDGDFAKLLDKLLSENAFKSDLDTLDLKSRIIRLEDYLLHPLFLKIFSIVRISMKYPQRTHHIKISNEEILKSLNKPSLQPLIQYDMSINPIGEALMFFKCSIFGVDGLNKDQISLSMRNMHPSYYGTLCSVDTPDGPNCGVVTSIVPTAQIDLDTGHIEVDKKMKTKDIVSLSVATCPFVSSNDGVRLQMGANQMEQSFVLKDQELPLIKTGTEHLIAKLSTFTKKAPIDGKVTFINKYYIVIEGENDITELVSVKSEYSLLNVFKFFKPIVQVGDEVKKGDVIAVTPGIKDKQVAFGRTLKTAFYCYFGRTYEDAILISESTAEKLSYYKNDSISIYLDKSSVLVKHNDKYLPNVGDFVDDGILAKKLKLHDSPEFLFDSANLVETIEIPKNSEICKIDVFINDENERDKEFNKFLLELEKVQLSEEQEEFNTVKKYVKDQHKVTDLRKRILKSSKRGKFYSTEHFEGVLIKVYFRTLMKTEIGDKLANRAGNKGVVSLILPDNEMPKDEDGIPVDICINPMGLTTRMNPGQMYELSVTAVCKKVTNIIKDMTYKKGLRVVLEFISDTDNSKGKRITKQAKAFIASLDDKGKKLLFDKIVEEGVQIYQPPFESMTAQMYLKLLEKYDVKEKQHLTVIPPAGKGDVFRTIEPVAIGYMYIEKLIHTSAGKVHSRAVGPYSKLTGQPLKGKRNQGAQRIGEMEIWALAAHEATSNIKEILTIKSDDIKGRKKMLRHFIDATPISLPNSDSSLAKKIFESYLNTLMLDLKKDE